MASRKDPAVRTCSQVSVVRLAALQVRIFLTYLYRSLCVALTAERGDGCVDRLYQHTLAMNLSDLV